MLTRRLFVIGTLGSLTLAVLPDSAAAEPQPPETGYAGRNMYPDANLYPEG